LGGLAVDQRHSADLSGVLGLDHVFSDLREIHHFTESVTDFVRTIVQPAYPNLVAIECIGLHTRERQYGFTHLDSQLACGLTDCAGGDFFDAIDNRQTDLPPSASAHAQ